MDNFQFGGEYNLKVRVFSTARGRGSFQRFEGKYQYFATVNVHNEEQDTAKIFDTSPATNSTKPSGRKPANPNLSY